jgi:subtilisin family serine protease
MRTLYVVIVLTFTSVYCSAAIPLWGLKAIKVKEAWEIAGQKNQGKGVRILDIDSGIDLNISSVKNFRQGLWLGKAARSSLPYDYYDERGHGSSVVGIIVGVAPQVELYMAKLDFEASEQEMIDELQRGVEWGISIPVEIINIEDVFGDDDLDGVDHSKLDSAIKRAYDSGITITVPAGNGNGNKVAYPGILPWAISAGEVNVFNERKFGDYGTGLALVAPGESIRTTFPIGHARDSKVNFEVGGTIFQIESMGFVRSPFVKAMKGFVTAAGNGTKLDFEKFPPGQIALIHRMPRQLISIQLQINEAIKAGVAALFLCNNEPLLSTKYAPLTDPESKIPVIYLDRDCEQLMKRLDQGEQVFANLSIVPGDIVSFSGTSSAAPHVAGTIALMKAVNPSLTSKEVLQILQQTATPIPSNQNEFGAGLINAADAVRRSLKPSRSAVAN